MKDDISKLNTELDDILGESAEETLLDILTALKESSNDKSVVKLLGGSCNRNDRITL